MGFGKDLKYRVRLLLVFPRALWLELCSFYSRIGILYKNNLPHCGIDLGAIYERDCNGYLRKNIETQSRILSTRKLLSIHPAASYTDFHLLSLSLRLPKSLYQKTASELGGNSDHRKPEDAYTPK